MANSSALILNGINAPAGTNADGILQITGGNGGVATGSAAGGTGAGFTLAAGAGGGAATGKAAGIGGGFTLTGGNGGAGVTGQPGASGGAFSLTGGAGGTGVTGQSAGAGGALMFSGGAGGNGVSGSPNGNGGAITLQGGAAGSGGTGGAYGNILLAPSGGNVGIGTNSPQGLFSVGQTSPFQVNGSGQITALGLTLTAGKVQPSADSTTALQLVSANGSSVVLDVDTTNQRVGLGTTNPAALLAVGSGSPFQVNAAGNTTAATLTLSARVVQPSADSTTALQFAAANGTTVVVNVDTTNQRVGVGTTSPSALLSVGAGSPFQVNSTGQLTALGATLSGGKIQPSADSTTALQLVAANGSSVILNLDTTNQRVGIGTITPSALLSVGSGATSPFQVNGSGQITAAQITLNGSNPAIVLSSPATRIQPSADSTTAVQLATASGAVVLNVDTTNQRVGIGTTQPKNPLDIAGAAAVGTYAGSNAGPTNGLIVSGNVGIGNSGPTAPLVVGSSAKFQVSSSGQATAAGLILNPGTIQPNADSTTALQLASANGTIVVLDVDTTNRRVGIGTSTPLLTLDVNGSARLSDGYLDSFGWRVNNAWGQYLALGANNGEQSGTMPRNRGMQAADTDYFDAADPTTGFGSLASGFEGAIFDGRRVYWIPFGSDIVGQGGPKGGLLAYDITKNFHQKSSFEFQDLTALLSNPKAAGFLGACLDANGYLYFAPYFYNNSVAVVPNTTFIRFNTTKAVADPTAYDVFDWGTSITGHPPLYGWATCVFDGQYIYYCPIQQYAQGGSTASGIVVRYDTTSTSFQNTTSWSWYDVAGQVNSNLASFQSCIFDGRWVYLIPFYGSGSAPSGYIARYDTTQTGSFASPATGAWDYFNIASLNSNAKAFTGGCIIGRYLYLVPWGGKGNPLSVVARFDTRDPGGLGSGGTTTAWQFFDLTNIPNISPSPAGYEGAWSDGIYLYLVPSQNTSSGSTTGPFIRHDTRESFSDANNGWSYLTLATPPPQSVGAAWDGRYGYQSPYGTAMAQSGKIYRMRSFTPGPTDILGAPFESIDLYRNSVGQFGFGTKSPSYTITLGANGNAYGFLQASGALGMQVGTIGILPLRFFTNSNEVGRFTAAGSFLIGTGALALSATDGFLYIPTVSGGPTGTPTSQSGRVPIVYDSTDNRLYVYNGGAWKSVTLS
jgi:hypothetical protein